MKFSVGEICEVEGASGIRCDCEIIAIGNPYGFLHDFSADYTIDVPSNPCKSGEGPYWICEERWLHKKYPPRQDIETTEWDEKIWSPEEELAEKIH